MPEERRQELLSREWVRGRELRRDGVIVRIWRIPGALRNVGIWKAGDATELHEHISSLPLFRWFDVQVTALAAHPVETRSE
jgi:muconolactone D-isomerase